MDSNCSTRSDSRLCDKKCIKQLEKVPRNCFLEIGCLQEQLSLCSIEANCVGEYVHSLELKIAGVGIPQEKLRLLTEELVQSDDKCIQLSHEIKTKSEKFKNYEMQIEELEATISSTALESQCEVECLRLDMLALEERCFEAESSSRQMVQDKAKMNEILEEYKMQLQDAQDRIIFFELENDDLKAKLQGIENKYRGLHYKVGEHLSNLLKDVSRTSNNMHREPHKNLCSGLNEKHFSLKGICACEEVLCPLVSKLSLITVWLDNIREEMQTMGNNMHESELLVEKLKEELKEEKLKAKEEAEDLTQAMAELRYEIQGQLEDECKRRVSIEQASLRRIEDLEEQVKKQQRKFLSALILLQEVHKLSEAKMK